MVLFYVVTLLALIYHAISVEKRLQKLQQLLEIYQTAKEVK